MKINFFLLALFVLLLGQKGLSQSFEANRLVHMAFFSHRSDTLINEERTEFFYIVNPALSFIAFDSSFYSPYFVLTPINCNDFSEFLRDRKESVTIVRFYVEEIADGRISILASLNGANERLHKRNIYVRKGSKLLILDL